jgi:hypothetical protein
MTISSFSFFGDFVLLFMDYFTLPDKARCYLPPSPSSRHLPLLLQGQYQIHAASFFRTCPLSWFRVEFEVSEDLRLNNSMIRLLASERQTFLMQIGDGSDWSLERFISMDRHRHRHACVVRITRDWRIRKLPLAICTL